MPDTTTMRVRERRFFSPLPAFQRAKLEPIHQPLYSAGALDAAALPRELTVFQYAIGGTVAGAGAGAVLANLWHTNMVAQGLLPSPKLFQVQGIRVVFSQVNAVGTGLLDPTYSANPENTDAEDDYKLFHYGGCIKFFVGVKDYYTGPLFLVPGNTGIDGFAAMAIGGTVQGFMRDNKAHSAGKACLFPQFPILIPSQQNFNVSLQWLQATPATMIDTHMFWVVLDGIYGREVA
jgi:hypothetical protein